MAASSIKAMIVEDSRLAREELKSLLEQHPEIEVVAEASHPDQALPLIENLKPALIFLDINMPGKSGFDLLEELKVSAQIIFTTAYSDYAIRSFDYNTIDYLLKPISPERLAKALQKLNTADEEVAETEDSGEGKLENDSRIFIKDGESCFLVELEKIRRFESCGNHTRVFFADEKPFLYKSLAKIEARLPEYLFFRANRQQIINLQHVANVDNWVNGGYRLLMSDGEEVEVSRRHAARFKALLSL